MKRLALFLDGTWNTLNNNTNVWRLKSLCAQDANQFVYYSQGVGTRLGETARGGVTGYGIDNEIIEAYTWLIQNFEPGDEIFIFGFSRGAYTARSLSGLISKCGVLTLGAPLSIEQLYTRYRRRTEATIRALQSQDQKLPKPLEEDWLVRYSQPTEIKFVGVWDTVGSLGLPTQSLKRKIEQYRFLDTHLYKYNEYAFHALALDENRGNFEPTFWTKTVNKNDQPPSTRPIDKVEQRWFVGAHANIGGGYPSDVLAQLPLKWLMDKASAIGLKFRKPLDLDKTSSVPAINDSFGEFARGLYRYISRRYYRTVGLPAQTEGSSVTSRINETIDGSVFDRWRADDTYRPANLVDWAKQMNVDPAALKTSVMALEPKTAVA